MNVIAHTRYALSVCTETVLDTGLPAVIKGIEGGGKTTIQFEKMPDRHFEKVVRSNGMSGQEFLVFGTRSYEQTHHKLEEYIQQTRRPAVLLRSFTDHYHRSCRTLEVDPIDFIENPEVDGNLLQMAREQQPQVWDHMVESRKAIWSDAPFNGGRTAIFTPHAVLHKWHQSKLTKVWNHPDFDPTAALDDLDSLAGEFHFSTIVHDEVETDSLLEVIPNDLRVCIFRCRDQFKDWRNQPFELHRDNYVAARETHPELENIGFWRFDELMRLDFDGLTEAKVDYFRHRFGHDRHEQGLYRGCHGNRFYVGPKEWLAKATSDLIILTTEELPTLILEGMRLETPAGVRRFRCHRFDESPLHPIRVPLIFDSRANQNGIQGLAEEIRDQHPNAVVIADMVKDRRLAITFQSAKGANDLKDHDIFVIPTHLSPGLYSILSAIGSYLDYDDVLITHYQDNINQAIGRNTGFRGNVDNSPIIRVIMSRRLWQILHKLGFNIGNRTILDKFNND